MSSSSCLHVSTFDKDEKPQSSGWIHVSPSNQIVYADPVWEKFIGKGHNNFFHWLVQIEKLSFNVKRYDTDTKNS